MGSTCTPPPKPHPTQTNEEGTISSDPPSESSAPISMGSTCTSPPKPHPTQTNEEGAISSDPPSSSALSYMHLSNSGNLLSNAHPTQPNNTRRLDASKPPASTQHAVIPPVPELAFGQKEWKQYFGDVGSAPDLPSDIAAILDGPCPFWPDQLVKDTHLLVLIPATVGGVPFTLNQLEELIQHPKNGGHSTKYDSYGERIKAQIGEQSPPYSYWLLMTRDVLPESRKLDATQQKTFLEGRANYELPTTLETATTILMHYVRTEEYLFKGEPSTYARCHGLISNPDAAHIRYNIYVGGFDRWGLSIDCPMTGAGMTSYPIISQGVAASRKL